MSLATLLNIPTAGDFRTLNEMSFSNQDQHRQIARAVQAQQGIALNVYPLDPIPAYDLTGWLQLHQQAHNDMASVLNIGNYDLSSLDFQNQGQVAAWVRLHFSMHQQAAQILGLN
jgi:hypothetical protein